MLRPRWASRRTAAGAANGSGSPDGSQEEAYRVLRSNVGVGLADIEHPSVMITSAQPGEGKTSTAINLAAALAAARHRVVLVDLDLRHPDVHRWMGAHNEFGVTDVLLERKTLESCLQYIEIASGLSSGPSGVYVLATGPSVSQPAELLGTRRLPHMLESLTRQADIVLIDTAPVLPVADSLAIGRIVSGALLVVEMRRTPVAAVHRAKDALTRNQTRLLGVVMNKLQMRDAEPGYGYGYGYGSTHEAAGAGAGSESAR